MPAPSLARLATRVAAGAVAAVVVGAVGACDRLLEVDNPSFIDATDVRTAQSADLWANGALAKVESGWDGMLLLLSAASDELRFVGQYAQWGELDRGDLSTPGNAGLNSTFPLFASAQWFTTEGIHVVDSLYQAGALEDRLRPTCRAVGSSHRPMRQPTPSLRSRPMRATGVSSSTSPFR